jgi:hypothetical protein
VTASVVILLGAIAAGPTPSQPAGALSKDDLGWVLEFGDATQWPAAFQLLIQERLAGAHLRSALKRLPTLPPADQTAYLEHLAGGWPRVDDAMLGALLAFTQHTDARVGKAAWKVALRVQPRNLAPLAEAFRSAGSLQPELLNRLTSLHREQHLPEDRSWSPALARRFADKGVRAPELVALLEPLATSPDAKMRELFFRHAGGVADPEIDRILLGLAQGPSAQEARQLLDKRADADGYERKRDLEIAARATDPLSRSPILLGISGALAVMLGLLVMIWGLRVLQLRRLLLATPPLPVQSAPMGISAVRGQAQPMDGAAPLRHPVTGEICVHYPRLASWGPQRFWLVDESGRIAVDARGAILLSEDDMLVPGEQVQVFGEVRRTEDGGREVVRPSAPRTAAQRLIHFCLHTLLGAGARRGMARLLLSDPRRCLVIWDDAGSPPLARTPQVMLLVLVLALAGIWIAVYGAVATGLADVWVSG